VRAGKSARIPEGHTEALHESLTQTPHSFKQTVQGIKNLTSLRQNVTTNTVITKENLPHLKAIAEFLIKLSVKDVTFSFPDITGGAFKNFDVVVSRYSAVGEEIPELVKFCDDNSARVKIADMPLCQMNGCMKNATSIDRRGVIDLKLLEDTIIDFSKSTKIEKCSQCKNSDICDGPHPRYIEKYGNIEIKPM
jgi:sulfatase maturation enzyme AslB (radical SAM superfamily)